MVEVPDLSQVVTMKCSKRILIDSAIAYIKKHLPVVYAERPLIVETATSPNDEYYSSANQWYLFRINAPQAWDITKGKSEIKIDINDKFIETNENGIDLPEENQVHQPHVDINTKYVQEFGTQGSWGGPGYYGGHGTLVSGVCAAKTNNSSGISALGWNLSLTKSIIGNTTDIVTASDVVDVINMSWYSIFNDYQSLRDAINTALTKGVVCVSAAANSSKLINLWGDTIGPPFVVYPAAYNFGTTGQVISISGTMLDQIPNGTEDFISWLVNGQRRYYNYSPGTDPINDPTNSFIDFSAPGGCITSTVRYNEYSFNYVWGTSLAAPQVSALCGLILSLNDQLIPSQVYDILKNSADKIGSYSYDVNGWNRYLGYGRINAYKALKYTLEHYGGTLTQSITIPLGETWTLSPGVTWKFPVGTGLTVYGSLVAEGTSTNNIIFTSDNPSNKWNGIVFSGTGAINSIMRYCKIENVETYPSITLSGVYNISQSPVISNCDISNNSIAAIALSNSFCNIYNNKIVNNYIGIYNYASTVYGGISGISHDCSNWNNRIENNYVGITASGSSIANFGSSGSSAYGYNSISNNTNLNVYAYEYFTGNMEYNWWGSVPPPMGKFNISGDSYLDYGNYLSCTPPSLSKRYITEHSSGNLIHSIQDGKDLKDAIGKEIERNYQDAVKAYKSIMLNSKEDSKEWSLSVVGLARIFKLTKDETIFNSLSDQYKALPQNPLLMVNIAEGLIISGKIEESLKLIDLVRKNNPNSYFDKNALVQTAIIGIYYKKDLLAANNVIEELSKKYEDKVMVSILNILSKNAVATAQVNNRNGNIEPKSINSLQKDAVIKITEDIILTNYPNPFNPSTTIQYRLKESGFVTLKVYDILGKEINTLVNENKETGQYTVIFDASKLSSGTYFYKLTVKPMNGGKEIIQQKSMQVVK